MVDVSPPTTHATSSVQPARASGTSATYATTSGVPMYPAVSPLTWLAVGASCLPSSVTTAGLSIASKTLVSNYGSWITASNSNAEVHISPLCSTSQPPLGGGIAYTCFSISTVHDYILPYSYGCSPDMLIERIKWWTVLIFKLSTGVSRCLIGVAGTTGFNYL